MILVTGSTGFVGSALCEALRARGTGVRAAVRGGAGDGEVNVGNLDGHTDWRAALVGCDTVIHLAARVHVMRDGDQDPLRAYREVNVDATLNLARQARAAGVQRFVFVSSVKVNGEATGSAPYRASDVPHPVDPYGVSKFEAEQALRQFAGESGLEVVIVRPPLVYGPGVKANFRNLMKVVRFGVPLPFGRVGNYRSMVALDNLVDLLIVCSTHPNASGEIFMVSDGRDLNIAELVTMIAKAMHKKLWLVPIPAGWLTRAAGLLGKGAIADRLLGTLQVDITDTQAKLEWCPVVAPQAAIDKTVAHFLAQYGREKQ